MDIAPEWAGLISIDVEVADLLTISVSEAPICVRIGYCCSLRKNRHRRTKYDDIPAIHLIPSSGSTRINGAIASSGPVAPVISPLPNDYI